MNSNYTPDRCAKYQTRFKLLRTTGDLITPLLRITELGLFCERGKFYIDPWRPVETAVLTHAHSDHARAGSQRYITSSPGLAIVKHRLSESIIEGLPYRQTLRLGDVNVSLHPAGHILGSAQVRVECDGEVWVAAGDFKRNPDPTCESFEVIKCDVFITEATFALPIYRWQEGPEVAAEIMDWWNKNAQDNRPSILFCYALGKAQRVLAELLRFTDRPIFVHGAVESLTRIYRQQGITMLETKSPADVEKSYGFEKDLILAPPSAYRSPWMKRFKNADTGFASGWMQVRGARRRGGYDRGFVLSDHADWNDLIRTARETQAGRILATHGSSETLVRYLREMGVGAEPLATRYGDDVTEGET